MRIFGFRLAYGSWKMICSLLRSLRMRLAARACRCRRRGRAPGRRCSRPGAARRGRSCSCPSPIRRPGRASRRAAIANDTSSTARTGRSPAAEVLLQVAHLDQRRASADAWRSCQAAFASRPGTRTQRACRASPVSTSGGMRLRAGRRCAWSQRGSKAQPGGGASGLETWPRIANSRARLAAAPAARALPGRQASRPCV